MTDKIEGPLGLWPWPVLNTLITLAEINSGEEDDVRVIRASNIQEGGKGDDTNMVVIDD